MSAGRLALIGALLSLLAIPWLVLTDRLSPHRSSRPRPIRSITPSPAAPIDARLAGAFGEDASAASDDPLTEATPNTASDAPQISGIVGRLPDHAIALVKRPAGGMRTIGLGETIDGWRLESLSANAALFSRDQQRVRVELPRDPR